MRGQPLGLGPFLGRERAGGGRQILGQWRDAYRTAQEAGTTGPMLNRLFQATFSVAKRKASTGRNPRTGETMQIKASTLPKFKAGKGLKDAVN